MKSKTAAMEMSVGTIVTIVLLMTVLVLGIFLVNKIFDVGTNAIDSIGTEVENEIQKLFSADGKRLAVYPTSRDIKVKKGDDPKGFAFAVKNIDSEDGTFTYDVIAGDVSRCNSLTKTEAENFLMSGSGSFSLGSGNSLEPSRLVKLDIPKTANLCTFIYVLEIEKDGNPYATADIFVTIK